MKSKKEILDLLLSKKLTSFIINILGILLIGLLIQSTQPIWRSGLNTVWAIIKPFVFGFTIAFVLETMIARLQKFIPKRGICVAITYLGAIGFFFSLIMLMIPMVYSSIFDMFPFFQSGVLEINDFIVENFEISITPLLDHISNMIMTLFDDNVFVNATVDVLLQTASMLGNSMIYLILSIYMSMRYPSIRRKIYRMSAYFSKNLPSHIIEVEYSLGNYIQAFIIDAFFQGITVATMYLIIGQPNWLILGIISAVSSIFPYVGPIAANVLGIIVSLSLGPYKVVALLVLIAIQSTLTAYVITPRIYSKQIDLGIFSVLFGILSGGVLFGAWGMIIAMPILVIAKIIYRIYLENYRMQRHVK